MCCGNNCGGSCGPCGSCSHDLVLTKDELTMLSRLTEIPFLPVACQEGSHDPIYLEDNEITLGSYSAVIKSLYQKRLITLDYDIPLSGFNYAPYAAYSSHGSMALTAYGQQIADRLEHEVFMEDEHGQ
ncbi:MAG: hypothetical protein VB078_00745 [Clostridiaceae bacterium]|nr:hypothetical protein [Clostridiaceae bacterium]